MRTEHKLFLTVMLCYMYFTHPYMTTNDTSHLALTVAIVENRSLEIGFLPYKIITIGYNPVDYAVYKGKIYSDKAPLGSFLAVPVYALFRLFTDNYNVLGYICSVFISALPAALTALLLYDLCYNYTRKKNISLLITFGYAFATPAFYYATIWFSHSLTTFFAFACFWIVEKIRTKKFSQKWMVVAGLCAGFVVVSDYYGAILTALITLYVLYVFPSYSRISFILSLLPPLLLLGVYHYLLFENPLTTPYRYQGTFSVLHRNGIYGVNLPSFRIISKLLFGSDRGLFYYSPLIFLSFFGLYRMLATHKREAILIFIIFLSFLCFNAGFINWRGGACWGPRYLTPTFPFIAFIMVWFPWNKKNLRIIAYFLFTISLVVNLLIVNSSYLPPDNIHNPLLNFALPMYLKYGSLNLVSLITLYHHPTPEPNPIISTLELAPLILSCILLWYPKSKQWQVYASLLFFLIVIIYALHNLALYKPGDEFVEKWIKSVNEGKTLTINPAFIVESLLRGYPVTKLMEKLHKDYQPIEMTSPSSLVTLITWRPVTITSNITPSPILKQPNIPSSLRGNNYYHLNLIPSNPLPQPLYEGKHVKYREKLYSSPPPHFPQFFPSPQKQPIVTHEVYVTSVRAHIARVAIDTHVAQIPLAHSVIYYDLENKRSLNLTTYGIYIIGIKPVFTRIYP